MINPTGSDKILTNSSNVSEKSRASGKESAGRASPDGPANGTTGNRTDSVAVSQAARIISQAESTSVGRPSASVDTPEQAEKLVSRILQQIRETGSQALQAQAGIQSDQFTALLRG